MCMGCRGRCVVSVSVALPASVKCQLLSLPLAFGERGRGQNFGVAMSLPRKHMSCAGGRFRRSVPFSLASSPRAASLSLGIALLVAGLLYGCPVCRCLSHSHVGALGARGHAASRSWQSAVPKDMGSRMQHSAVGSPTTGRDDWPIGSYRPHLGQARRCALAFAMS